MVPFNYCKNVTDNVRWDIQGHKLLLAIQRWVFNTVFYLQTSNEEDTSYSPVTDKEKEDPQNGTYIGLTPKGDPQDWGGR